MRAYLIRRLLLIPVTLLGVTMLVFGLTRILPGGPVERMMMAKQAGEGQRASREGAGSATLTEAQKVKLERQFLLDKSYFPAYAAWLGIWPREINHRDLTFPIPKPLTAPVLKADATPEEKTAFEEAQKKYEAAVQAKADAEDPSKEPVLKAGATPEEIRAFEQAVTDRESAQGWQRIFIWLLADGSYGLRAARVRLTPDSKIEFVMSDGSALPTSAVQTWKEPEKWYARFEEPKPPKEGEPPPPPPENKTIVVHQKKFSGVLQWEFGESFLYGDPVIKLVTARLPISFFYAVLTLLITYIVSIPLGILKAIKHRTWVDSSSSVLIFVGYAIPGFALGVMLLYWFAFRIEWFAIRDFTSENFASLSLWDKVKDLAWHNTLPLICYLVSAFALTTMMMKNNLMDNLAADYVRTAVAKGSRYSRAVFRHAVRNSLIPIATTFGHHLVAFVSGSVLVETVFDIYGLGLLSFTALDQRDYFVVMAMIFLISLALMIGNLISDILVAMLNPRIRFD